MRSFNIEPTIKNDKFRTKYDIIEGNKHLGSNPFLIGNFDEIYGHTFISYMIPFDVVGVETQSLIEEIAITGVASAWENINSDLSRYRPRYSDINDLFKSLSQALYASIGIEKSMLDFRKDNKVFLKAIEVFDPEFETTLQLMNELFQSCKNYGLALLENRLDLVQKFHETTNQVQEYYNNTFEHSNNEKLLELFRSPFVESKRLSIEKVIRDYIFNQDTINFSELLSIVERILDLRLSEKIINKIKQNTRPREDGTIRFTLAHARSLPYEIVIAAYYDNEIGDNFNIEPFTIKFGREQEDWEKFYLKNILDIIKKFDQSNKSIYKLNGDGIVAKNEVEKFKYNHEISNSDAVILD